MSFLVVANFKSNLTQKQVESWIQAVKPTPNIVVAPSFPHITSVLRLSSGFCLAAQDVSPFPPGSYTGAINASQLKELGVGYCLVGHSERRRYFHETPVDVAAKVRELLALDITPILCLDEGDITPQFAALDPEFYPQCLYCFEPGDGLGGTQTTDTQTILAVKKQIDNFVPGARFMYGGSVNADNIASLLPLHLSGVLVSTASLNPLSYLSILEKVSHAS